LTWVPYFSLYFFAYEALTGAFCGTLAAGEQPPFLTALGCGLAAGVGASIVTNPFDVVKTRIMVGNVGLGAATAAGGGALAVARDIAMSEGLAGFTRGMIPRLLLLAPASSLTIAFYAAVQNLATTHLAPRDNKHDTEKRK
jgi:hypothetical protein